MFLVISPDSSFNGEFAGYKFKNGNCITELDDNLQLWWRNTDGMTVDDLLEECKQELN